MSWRTFRHVAIAAAASIAVLCRAASAEEVTVAVAANFINPLRALEIEFETTTGHEVSVISGSTGQLYAQIANGAPFDVLLAADQVRPRLLADAGFGDRSSVLTYAVGRLALWSAEADRLTAPALASALESDFRWLAIAEPAVAPYGAAAQQALEALGVWESLQSRLVRGQNIAQTFAMVETGNAELGLIALSQALAYAGRASYIEVPQHLHDPIRQDAIVLNPGSTNLAAMALMRFLRSAEAAEIIESYGYSTIRADAE